MSLDNIQESYSIVMAHLKSHGELSHLTNYEEISTKTLIIAAAGDLEREVTKVISDMPIVHDSPAFLSNFIKKQALDRKYHTMFDWNAKHINRFAGLFGAIKRDEIIEVFSDNDIAKNFIFIGAERNRIVHEGLAYASVAHTFEDIWSLYNSAKEIVPHLRTLLHCTPTEDSNLGPPSAPPLSPQP